MSVELDKLKLLYEQGVIDEVEYQAHRNKIIARMITSPGLDDQSGGNQPTPTITPPPTFEPGDRLSDGSFRFVLWRRLGVGGMGEVWLALNERLQEQGDPEPFVALKFIHPGRIGSAQARQQLITEGVQARKLSHANIVNTLNVYDDGTYVWLEMDYLGRDPKIDPRDPPQSEPAEPDRVAHTLSAYRYQRAGEEGLALAEALQLLRPVAEALDYARRQHNIVHRDIKASNIMRCADGRVAVMDFGLAHRLKRGGSNSGLNADVIDGAGTIEYRAPETFEAHKPSRRQDVYSLAVLAYELLTGQLPWSAERCLRRSESQAIGGQPPPQLGLAEGEYGVLCAGMAWHADKRPDSAGALVEALAGAAEQEAQSQLLAAVTSAEQHRAQELREQEEAAASEALDKQRESAEREAGNKLSKNKQAEKQAAETTAKSRQQEVEAARATIKSGQVTNKRTETEIQGKNSALLWVVVVAVVIVGGGWMLVNNLRIVQLASLNPLLSKPERQPFEPEMLDIPAGNFRVGDISGGGEDDEKPVHAVNIKAFKLAKTEVTVGQFKAV